MSDPHDSPDYYLVSPSHGNPEPQDEINGSVCDSLDRIEASLTEIEQNVCDRLAQIEVGLDQVETAIKDSRLNLSWVGLLVVGWLVLMGLSDLWHSKAAYAWWYKVQNDQVTIEKQPTDCNFFRSPLGDKGCHYDRHVSAVRVKTEYVGLESGSVNYVSFDNGNTWTVDSANPPTEPQVVVSWERVEGE